MYTYKALVTKVIDGDTIDVDIDLGFNVHVHERIRLLGINTPEIFGSKAKNEIERQKGLDAKQFVESWVASQNNVVMLTTHDAKALKKEKYGRWLALICPLDSSSEEESLNHLLVENGHAKKS